MLLKFHNNIRTWFLYYIMMIKDRIEDLRDKLYIILENEEYNLSKILKTS